LIANPEFRRSLAARKYTRKHLMCFMESLHSFGRDYVLSACPEDVGGTTDLRVSLFHSLVRS
jgi:hypothetical protein